MPTLYSPPVALASDVNTLVCWPMTGASPEPDIGPHGFNLTVNPTNVDIVGGADLGLARCTKSGLATGLYTNAGGTVAGICQPALLGEWTMELMVYFPQDNSTGDRWLLTYIGLNGGTTPYQDGTNATNILGGIRVPYNASTGLTGAYMGWQTGANSWVFLTGPNNIAVMPGTWMHLLARKKLNVDNVHYDASLWLNGTKIFELLAQTNASGGNNSNMGWTVGTLLNGGEAGHHIVDRVKIHTVALSDAAINQRYLDSTWQPTSAPTLTLTSTTPGVMYVDLVFSSSLAALTAQAALPSAWTVTGPTSVTVTSVTLHAANTIRVQISEPLTGGSYTLTIPSPGILSSPDGTVYIGPWTTAFTGQGVAPTVAFTQALSGHRLRVLFSVPVQTADALTVSNYSVPGLTVLSVAQESASVYILTTTQQDSGLAYTLTVSNVRDLAGNSI